MTSVDNYQEEMRCNELKKKSHKSPKCTSYLILLLKILKNLDIALKNEMQILLS